MSHSETNPSHITTTETVLRFYVFLGQYIDRCLDDTARQAPPEEEFQQYLADTHAQIAELLETNRVVKNKTEVEYQRITTLCENFLKDPSNKETTASLKHEYDVLKTKMVALSDLVAVFRSV